MTRMSLPNAFAYPMAITLDSLDDLFAHHARHFGGFEMVDPPADPPNDPPADPPAFQPITSQEDFDRRLSDRLRREREKYADYADLKKKAEAHDKALEAAMSESEKAVAAARKEGEAAAQEKVNDRLKKAEARALAAAADFRDPTDAVAFLDLANVGVDDNGEVDADAIRDQLKKLAESKAYLVNDGKKPAPRPDPSQGGGSGSRGSGLAGLGGSELYDRLHPKKTA